MGKAARRKGHDFEREVAKRFREAMPGAEVCRGQQARDGGDAPDVSPPCFWVEVKHRNKLNERAALEQAMNTAPIGRTPVAICKKTRQKPNATIMFCDLYDLVDPSSNGAGGDPDDIVVTLALDEFFNIVAKWWKRVNQ